MPKKVSWGAGVKNQVSGRNIGKAKSDIANYVKILRTKIPSTAGSKRKALWVKLKTNAKKNLKKYYLVAKHNIRKNERSNANRLKKGISVKRSTENEVRGYKKLLAMIPIRARHKTIKTDKTKASARVPMRQWRSKAKNRRVFAAKNKVENFIQKVAETEKAVDIMKDEIIKTNVEQRIPMQTDYMGPPPPVNIVPPLVGGLTDPLNQTLPTVTPTEIDRALMG
jgi:hypothetical protein